MAKLCWLLLPYFLYQDAIIFSTKAFVLSPQSRNFQTPYNSKHTSSCFQQSAIDGRSHARRIHPLNGAAPSVDASAFKESMEANGQQPGPTNTTLPTHQKGHRQYGNITEIYNFWEDSLSVTSFNMDLQNLAQEDPQKAADALEIMEEMYHAEPGNNFTVKPTAACYTTVIDGWVQFQASSASSTPLAIVDEDDNSSNQGMSNQQYYNSNSNIHHYGAEQADAWLERLEAKYDETQDPDLIPNTVSYMLVCQKWADDYAQDFTGESAERAEQTLRKMRDRLGEANQDVKVWSIVLEAWCKRSGKVHGAIHRAGKLLREMEQLGLEQQQKGDGAAASSTIRPNIVTYTSFIGGLARSKERNVATKAEEVMKRMQKAGIEPDMVAYTAVLNCYSKTVSIKERAVAAKRALEILNFMETKYTEEEQYFLKPNVITYGTAIKAIGNSLDPRSSDLAEGMLRRMYDLYEEGKLVNIKPQTSTFNSVITALANHSRRIKGGRYHQPNNFSQLNSKQREKMSLGLRNAQRAEKLLVEMTQKARSGEIAVEPNVRSWGGVLSAWSESGQLNSGEQAQRVIRTMETLFERGESTIRPNFVCYTTVMAALANSASVSDDPSSNDAAADQVEAILKKMETEYEETGNVDKRPNTISYITAIDAFCRLDPTNAADRAQATVDRMMKLYMKGLGHVKPTRIVFNSLVNAWSRCRGKGVTVAHKAEQIFKWMERQFREHGDYIVKPDEISLCGVLNAWANHPENGGAQRAQQILDHMESMTTKERGFQHTTICHNIVIKAWGRSKAPDAVLNAERILLRLEEQAQHSSDDSLKPDVTTYSSVINCCAYYSGNNEGRQEAFDVAMRTFKKLCKSDSAETNNITYGTILKVIANLAPVGEERDKLVRQLFERCSKEGHVDSFVLSQVRNASPASLYNDLVLKPSGVAGNPGHVESIGSILKKMPPNWGRNVNPN